MGEKSESELFEEVYSTLLDYARHRLANERAAPLETAELVNSACRHILRSSRGEVTSAHKLRYLAWRAMGQVLIEHARKAKAGVRIPQRLLVAIQEMPPAEEATEIKLERLCTLEELSHAIERRFSKQAARIFLQQSLSPLTREEIAEAEDLSLRSIQRTSKKVYQWLSQEFERPVPPDR